MYFKIKFTIENIPNTFSKRIILFSIRINRTFNYVLLLEIWVKIN